jgi:hypothetical protein
VVLDPDAPLVAIFTVFARVLVVAPVAMLVAEVPVAFPKVSVAPENVLVPESVFVPESEAYVVAAVAVVR